MELLLVVIMLLLLVVVIMLLLLVVVIMLLLLLLVVVIILLLLLVIILLLVVVCTIWTAPTAVCNLMEHFMGCATPHKTTTPHQWQHHNPCMTINLHHNNKGVAMHQTLRIPPIMMQEITVLIKRGWVQPRHDHRTSVYTTHHALLQGGPQPGPLFSTPLVGNTQYSTVPLSRGYRMQCSSNSNMSSKKCNMTRKIEGKLGVLMTQHMMQQHVNNNNKGMMQHNNNHTIKHPCFTQSR